MLSIISMNPLSPVKRDKRERFPKLNLNSKAEIIPKPLAHLI
jgi:hypothetical protein